MGSEDVRIGRLALFTESLVAVGLASVAAVGGSANRFALILGAPLTGTATYSTTSPVVSGVGLNIAAGQPPVILTLDDHGQVVTQAWFVINSVAAQTIYVGSSIYAGQ